MSQTRMIFCGRWMGESRILGPPPHPQPRVSRVACSAYMNPPNPPFRSPLSMSPSPPTFLTHSFGTSTLDGHGPTISDVRNHRRTLNSNHNPNRPFSQLCCGRQIRVCQKIRQRARRHALTGRLWSRSWRRLATKSGCRC